MAQTSLRRLLLWSLIVLSAASAVAQSTGARPEADALIQLERDWDAAFERKDIRFVERVLAEEFIATYADGTRGDRAKELALTASFNQQVDSSSMEDFVVKVYGDTAVVWFSKHMTGPRQGRPVSLTYRYVDVFVRRAGRWQCVSSHNTKVAEL